MKTKKTTIKKTNKTKAAMPVGVNNPDARPPLLNQVVNLPVNLPLPGTTQQTNQTYLTHLSALLERAPVELPKEWQAAGADLIAQRQKNLQFKKVVLQQVASIEAALQNLRQTISHIL